MKRSPRDSESGLDGEVAALHPQHARRVRQADIVCAGPARARWPNSRPRANRLSSYRFRSQPNHQQKKPKRSSRAGAARSDPRPRLHGARLFDESR